VPKQEYYFFKCRLFGKIVNVVALVNQFALFTVHVRHGGSSGYYTSKPG
jgi:hypothetical protein